jgi:hypothetical protein
MNVKSRNRGDWMNMTPSDWMSMTPSEWITAAQPGWLKMPPSSWLNRSYSDLMNTSLANWSTMIYGPQSTPGAPTSSGVPARHHHPLGHGHEHGCGCGCRHCGSDQCQCVCCIGDVDFAIYSRVGEQRVIPIALENDRHRDKQIALELSPWTTRGGKAAPVDTVSLDPMTFTLPSCGEQKIKLVVNVHTVEGQGAKGTGDVPARAAELDVDDCLVAIADLRVTGCDNRSIRLAVAILPRDCDPYTVTCGCSCCC